jgi:hypothetical protein
MIGRLILIATVSAAWGGCAAAQSSSLRVGGVDVTVPAYAVVVDCPEGTVDSHRSWVNRCIEVPYSGADEDQNAISMGIVRSGWTFAGGAATQYWIERKLPDGDCELLYVTGLGPFDLSREEQQTAKGLIMFSHAASGPCRADETAQ